jgi:hypothetical protein
VQRGLPYQNPPQTNTLTNPPRPYATFKGESQS